MRSRSKHLLYFIALVFLLSIPFWILAVIRPIQLLPGLPVSALQAFIPAVAALIFAYKENRSSGALQLLKRSFDFRRIKNWKWYILIILINPVIAVSAYLFLRATDSSFPSPAPLTFTVIPLLIVFLITALGEELGWSGYATEPLLSTWGVIPTGILLGIVWAIWHFIPLLQVDRPIEWIAWWSFGTITLRMLMVWIFKYSGRSVFGAAVFHTMTNLCWQLFPVNGSHYDPRVFSLITFALVIIILTMQYFAPEEKTQAPAGRS